MGFDEVIVPYTAPSTYQLRAKYINDKTCCCFLSLAETYFDNCLSKDSFMKLWNINGLYRKTKTVYVKMRIFFHSVAKICKPILIMVLYHSQAPYSEFLSLPLLAA